ncbi:hypothetical protein Tco_1049019 [Tanacetum coccineum]
MNYNNLAGRSIHFGDVVDWEFLSNKGLAQYDPLHKGVTFRLGGVEMEMPFLEFRWRVGLYSERESRDVATLSGLRNAETVNSTRLTHMFWPAIGNGGYNVGNTKAKSIRNPRIKLAHRCITMTITGGKKTTNRVTKIDLFYLLHLWGRSCLIARSFGLLTNEMVSVLNHEPPPHVYRKTSFVKMELSWNSTRVSVVGRRLERLRRRVEVMMRKAMEKGETKELGAPQTSTVT